MSTRRKTGWDAEHFVYACTDGTHNSFWKTVIESPEWEAWTEEIHRRLKRTIALRDRERERESDLRVYMRRPALPAPAKWPQLWDVDECGEAGWMSPEHFADFVKFCRTTKARRCRQAGKPASQEGRLR